MRIVSLDYLRAILAVGVMIAHYSLWTRGAGNAADSSTRFELYRVPMFYLLSGVTLYYFYAEKLALNIPSLKIFFLKRIRRLAPLFYLATIITIVLFRVRPELITIITNFTGLFAVYEWDNVIVYGGWAIGNELVFYIAFPILVYVYRKSIPSFAVVMFILFGIFIYFSFFALTNEHTFIAQWKTYINPLNQLFIFGCGFTVGAIFKNMKLKPIASLGLIILGLLIFMLYPAIGDRIELVTGWARVAFTIACLLLIIPIFKLSIKLPEIFHNLFNKVAQASYSIYLLHPIVYRIFIKFSEILKGKGIHIPIQLLLLTSGLITILISYQVYLRFELYFMKNKKLLKQA